MGWASRGVIKSYGFPPEESECAEGVVPEFLTRKLTPTVVGAERQEGDILLGKPVSVVSIARQLNQYYEFTPTCVTVPGYGKFLLGPKGWLCSDEKNLEVGT